MSPPGAFRISAAALRAFAAEAAERVGASPENAATLAAALVDADLQGIGTHGISRLPAYVRRLERGLMDGKTKGRVVHRLPALAAIDGENGIGQVIGIRAMDVAAEIAGESGAGIVGVKNSNHFGVAGYYCERAAAKGLIGIAMTNSPKGIPPSGGSEPYFGTNPVAAGFPIAGRPPAVVDLSASVVARGNIIMAAKSRSPIPEGWAIDREGRATTDPHEALSGAVLPMAGHKGYALAFLVEALAGVMTGAGFGPHVRSMYDDGPAGTDIGHVLIAIDPGAFGRRGAFARRMAQMAAEIENVRPIPGENPPRLPGARRHALREERRAMGIELPAEAAGELAELANHLGACVGFPIETCRPTTDTAG